MSKKRKLEQIDNTNPPLKKQKLDSVSLSSELKAEILSYLPLDEISDVDDKLYGFNEICKHASRHHEILLSVNHYHRKSPEFLSNYDYSAIHAKINIHPDNLFEDNKVTQMIRKYWKQIRYIYCSTKTRSRNDLYHDENILKEFLNKYNLKLTFVTLLSFKHDLSFSVPSIVNKSINYDLNYLFGVKQLQLIRIPLCNVEAWNIVARNLPNLRYLNLDLNNFRMNNNKNIQVNNADNLWSLSIGNLYIDDNEEQLKYKIICKLLAAVPNLYHFRLEYNFWNVYVSINDYDMTIPANNIISLGLDHNWSNQYTNLQLPVEIIKQCPNLQLLSIPLLLKSAQGINWVLQLISYFVNKNIKNDKYLQLTWHDDSVYSPVPQQFIHNWNRGENVEQRIEVIYNGLRNRLIDEYKCDMENIQKCNIVARKQTKNDRTKRVVYLRKFISMVLGKADENIHDIKEDTFVSLANTTNLLQSNEEFREFSKFSERLPNFFFAFM